ncbi:MAG: division plane positioning ATPase MipZ, partial [Devosia sp.]
VIFRSLFPTGLTVFDPLDDDLLGGMPSMSHASARQEYRVLLEVLQLPVSERAETRRAAQAAWAQSANQPLRFEHMATQN